MLRILARLALVLEAREGGLKIGLVAQLTEGEEFQAKCEFGIGKFRRQREQEGQRIAETGWRSGQDLVGNQHLTQRFA